MSADDGFYTMKGYTLLSRDTLTSAMEDYLEMIMRLRCTSGSVRIIDLAKGLHVKASSATKMVQQLASADLVIAHRYGDVILTEKGEAVGSYLLYRHEVLNSFLCMLNNSENELEQVEKIEHFLDEKTIKNLEQLNIMLSSKK